MKKVWVLARAVFLHMIEVKKPAFRSVIRGIIRYVIKLWVSSRVKLIIFSLLGALFNFIWITVINDGYFKGITSIIVPRPDILLPVTGVLWSVMAFIISAWASFRLSLIKQGRLLLPSPAGVALIFAGGWLAVRYFLLPSLSWAHDSGWTENGGITGYLFSPNSWPGVFVNLFTGAFTGTGWLSGSIFGNNLAGTVCGAPAPQIPGALQVPDSPQFPDEPQAPGTTQSTDGTQAPGTTQPADGTQAPGTTQSTDGTQAPGSSQTLDAPQSSDPAKPQPSDTSKPGGDSQAADQNKDKLHQIINELKDMEDIDKRNQLIKIVKNAAQIDKDGVPHGDMDRISSFIQNQKNPDPGYGTLQSIWDTTKGTVGGTAAGALNVVTLGLSNTVSDNWKNGPGAVAGAVGNQLADIVTFGGYSGYQKGGLSGAGEGIIKTLLPVDEAGTIGDFVTGGDTTWDQAAGAAGSSILKIITLGKAGGKIISSTPMSAELVQQTKYGYHWTGESNIPSILKNGFESRAPGSHGGLSGAVSNVARTFKDAFVDNEPRKAGYMFGTSEPGMGKIGDVNFTKPPVIIDLTKVDPSKLNVRPFDGAVVFTGDKIPPSAISYSPDWKNVPTSSTPYTAQPFANVPQAVPWVAVNSAANQAFKDTVENK